VPHKVASSRNIVQEVADKHQAGWDAAKVNVDAGVGGGGIEGFLTLSMAGSTRQAVYVFIVPSHATSTPGAGGTCRTRRTWGSGPSSKASLSIQPNTTGSANS
jgi:hypothetical protein